MESLYKENAMKSIVTISSACALAFAGMASAQDAPAPAPAPAAETPAEPAAPAAEVSKEAKEAADQMLALMKEMSAQHGKGQGHRRCGRRKDGEDQ